MCFEFESECVGTTKPEKDGLLDAMVWELIRLLFNHFFRAYSADSSLFLFKIGWNWLQSAVPRYDWSQEAGVLFSVCLVGLKPCPANVEFGSSHYTWALPFTDNISHTTYLFFFCTMKSLPLQIPLALDHWDRRHNGLKNPFSLDSKVSYQPVSASICFPVGIQPSLKGVEGKQVYDAPWDFTFFDNKDCEPVLSVLKCSI